MGKVNDSSVLKRYRNNTRVDPASLSHYMCYYCGLTSFDRLEYQQHMLKVHEVLSQSYQLWSDHTMDSLGLRWSESKQSDEHEGSESSPASPILRTPKVEKSDDDDEDYVYEEEDKPCKKRRKDDEGFRSRGKKTVERIKKDEMRRKIDAENKRRKRAEERKREEKARRDEADRKAEEAKRMFEVKLESEPEPVTIVEKVEVVELPKRTPSTEKRKRRRTEGSRRRDEDQEKDKPEVAALVKRILEESKKKEASRQETEDEDIHAEPITDCAFRKPMEADVNTTKYCKICKKGTHFTFATIFEHYIIHHHAIVKSFHYYGYKETQVIGKKSLMEREFCQRCIVKLPSTVEYYKHMIANHMFESVRCQPDFEQATHADVEVKLEFRDRVITCGYRFSLNPDEQIMPAAVTVSEIPNEIQSDTELPIQNPTEVAEVALKEDEELKEEPKNNIPTLSAPVVPTPQ